MTGDHRPPPAAALVAIAWLVAAPAARLVHADAHASEIAAPFAAIEAGRPAEPPPPAARDVLDALAQAGRHWRLDTVVLLDALYVEYGLLPWLRGSDQHRLVNIVYETGRSSDYLHDRLPSTLRVDGLPADHLPDARILYVRTDVGHWDLVTAGV